nr:hypothetical protein CFP56_26030 [Quercus suber]
MALQYQRIWYRAVSTRGSRRHHLGVYELRTAVDGTTILEQSDGTLFESCIIFVIDGSPDESREIRSVKADPLQRARESRSFRSRHFRCRSWRTNHTAWRRRSEHCPERSESHATQKGQSWRLQQRVPSRHDIWRLSCSAIEGAFSSLRRPRECENTEFRFTLIPASMTKFKPLLPLSKGCKGRHPDHVRYPNHPSCHGFEVCSVQLSSSVESVPGIWCYETRQQILWYSQLFAEQVAALIRGPTFDPLYTAVHLKALNQNFLTRQASTHEDKEERVFAFLYDVSAGSFRAPKEFASSTDYELYLDQQGDKPARSLLFIAGYPTQNWLKAIGGTYGAHVAALPFAQHLRFMPSSGQIHHSFPAIPTAARRIIRLIVPTIGSCTNAKRIDTKRMQELRRSCNKSVLNQTQRLWSIRMAGCSIVRNFYLHDSESFSFEQEITITLVKRSGDEEWADDAFILRQFPEYQGSDLCIIPTVQQSRDTERRLWRRDDVKRPIHSLKLLPANYGKSLSPGQNSIDELYAVSELFNFAAAAEVQFLNLLQQVIARSTYEDQKCSPVDQPTLEDFEYHREILDRHVEQLKETIAQLQHLGRWAAGPARWLRDAWFNNPKDPMTQANLVEDRMVALQRKLRLPPRACGGASAPVRTGC